MEQALINLIRNATESAPSATVEISWQALPAELILSIRDTGPGLSGTENLFVPFFTTKENGSGIGLVLSRQIIEAHSGSLQLRNRTDSPGCEALIRLPR
ncbi:ATP-binding protein [Nostoc sp. NIES-2111]